MSFAYMHNNYNQIPKNVFGFKKPMQKIEKVTEHRNGLLLSIGFQKLMMQKDT